ncbi:MAG: hypothetical protein ACTSWP_11170 [Candidatus Freyarchaeota archaeon]
MGLLPERGVLAYCNDDKSSSSMVSMSLHIKPLILDLRFFIFTGSL